MIGLRLGSWVVILWGIRYLGLIFVFFLFATLLYSMIGGGSSPCP